MGQSWNLRMGGIHLGSDETPHSLKPADEMPFRILVLGDFSGRGSRGERATSLADRKLLRIDRDNFEDVMSRLRVEVQVSLAADASGGTARGGPPRRIIGSRCSERQNRRPRDVHRRNTC
jgi:hypothetical protein